MFLLSGAWRRRLQQVPEHASPETRYQRDVASCVPLQMLRHVDVCLTPIGFGDKKPAASCLDHV